MLNKLLVLFSGLTKKYTVSDFKYRTTYQFDALIDVADKIGRTHPEALPQLIKLIARKTQANAMSAALYYKTCEEIYEKVPRIDSNALFIDYSAPLNKNMENLHSIIKKTDYNRPLKLRTDVILPWPWSRDRIVGNLIGREPRTWRQDLNHMIEYWLPIGIGFVNNGNHSIACGIINGEGTIKEYNSYDISPLYAHIYSNGKHYLRTHDHSIIGEVKDLEFAAIFEIGRIMATKGVCA